MNKNENLNAIRKMDLANAAIHEAGHVVVARYYGLQTDAWLWENLNADYTKENLVGGRMWHSGTTAFRNACIGFAGYFAECFMWGEELQTAFECFFASEQSATDFDAVCGHAQKWRAAKTTWGILQRQWNDVKEEAEELIFNREEK